MRYHFGLILLVVWCVVAGAEPLSLKEVESYMQNKGSQPTRERYFSCWESKNAQGYKLIEHGDEESLSLAARLLSDADACYALGLQSSIAMAAIKNPSGVLKLVGTGPKLGAAYVCIPFMTDETDLEKMREQLKLLAKLERAFRSVRENELQEKKNLCLAHILPLKKELEIALTPGFSLP